MTEYPAMKTLAERILKRLDIDGTKDDTELVVVQRQRDGAFRRIVVGELPDGPTIGPKEYLTGKSLRELCKAAGQTDRLRSLNHASAEMGIEQTKRAEAAEAVLDFLADGKWDCPLHDYQALENYVRKLARAARKAKT